ncbi:MAG: SDR family NAD(P)-dependent oxidoreductase [Candidatus Binataceae bacterium]
MRLGGKVALITGGSRGIGRATALAFVREGAMVSLCARGEAGLRSVSDEIAERGGRSSITVCDVAVKEQAVATVTGTLEQFGRIDVLVNNAGGGSLPDHRSLLEMDDQCWFDNMNVHLNAVWYFTKAVLPHMVGRKSGSVINIASICGLAGMPNLGAYNAAKHGVIGLTRTLALEAGRFGITCNAICPGATRSGWTISDEGIGQLADSVGLDREEYTRRMVNNTPLRRLIEPEEIAEMAVYLASDAGRGITGQSIAICGGVTMH